MNYRRSFTAPGSAADYDGREYAPASGATILWTIERAALDHILDALHLNGGRYLDFACGTGRVLTHVSASMAQSVGIDVSQDMLAIAAAHALPRVTLICKDITLGDDDVESSYDLITAFRFFSNADDSLRREAAKALRRRMHERSVLIVNTHTNPWSYKALMWPVHELRRACGARVHARYLSRKRLREILREVNLTVIAEYGSGFVPASLHKWIGTRAVLAIETFLARPGWLQRFGVNHILVCRCPPCM